jgi:hypothetical protein
MLRVSHVDARFRASKAILAAAGGTSGHSIGPVQVEGEWLNIPFRIYESEVLPHAANILPEANRAIVACLYTRHQDGFVREREVLKILPVDEPWVVPFVVQLAGEYVVQIIEHMCENVDLMPLDRYRQFAADNPAFIDLTKARAISYWDCYYRREFPQFGDYPAFQFLNALGLWERRTSRRLKFSTTSW